MTEDNKALVRRFFEEFCNQRKMNIGEELFYPNHLHHDSASPWVGPGAEGMRQLISTYTNAFPDAHWSVDEMLATGDTVVTRWTGKGTHGAELLGFAPTNKYVVVPGIWIHRVTGSKISESWNSWDTLGMFQQLGILKPLAQEKSQAAG
jgi:steroid delta-isomerase-like uncharacterized protein